LINRNYSPKKIKPDSQIFDSGASAPLKFNLWICACACRTTGCTSRNVLCSEASAHRCGYLFS